MDLLEEIKRQKALRRERTVTVEVENPLPRWERAWEEVSDMLRVYCLKNHVTFAELIEDCRRLDPESVRAFYRLWGTVDRDVFGRWVNNRLTPLELESFYAAVERWKEAVRRMVASHERGKDNSSPALVGNGLG